MRKLLILIALAGILLSGCQPADPTKPSTQSYSEVQTAAAATVDSVMLTATAPRPIDTPDLTLTGAAGDATVTPDLDAGEATQEFATVTPIVLTDQIPTGTNSPTPTQTCPDGLRSNLEVGGKASVSSDPPTANNVRSGPSTTKTRRGKIQPGEVVEVLSGPECAEGIIWWEVRSLSTGLTGWTAEGDSSGYWLKPVP